MTSRSPFNTAACVGAAVALLSATGCAADRAAPPPPAAQQVTVGFYDGMTIRTANVYGVVEARVKSYGPGFCTTQITANDRTVSIAGPPAAYSPWVQIGSHTGALGFTLGKRDQCDTGTEIQIRYWR